MTASDDFSSPTLNPDWSFVGGPNAGVAVDENGDDAFLVLNTPDGEYDLWGGNRQAARVLQQADDDDFRIGAHFLSTPTERFQMQGLVVEGSDNKWLRVDTYFDGSNLRLFAAVTTGTTSTKVMSVTIAGGVAPYLALERVGDTFTVSYSLNGSAYTTAGSFNFAMTVDEEGVFAGNTGASTGFAAIVDWFEIDSDPLTNEDGSIGGGGTGPVAGDDLITAEHDGVDIAVADLLGNDSAPGGRPLTFVGFTDPPNGTLVDNGDGTLSYVPDAGFSGEDTFEYTVSDGTSEDVATVTISVPAAPGEVELSSDDFSGGTLSSEWTVAGKAGAGATVATIGTDGVLRISTPDGNYDLWGRNYDAGRVTQSAPDEDFTITVKFVSIPVERYEMQGLVVEGADGGWLRADTFSDGTNLKLFAATTNASGTSTTRISINIPGGEAPYLSLERDGDTWTVRYSTDGVTWVTGGSFTHAMTVTDVGLFAGNLAGSDGFAAAVDWFEVASDPLTVEDGSPRTNPPVAGDDSIAAEHDGVDIAIADLLGNDYDPDGGTLTFTGFTNPLHGTLVDNGDGTLSYVPSPGFVGQDTFTYTVSDGVANDVATVTITVPAEPGEVELSSDDFSGGALSSDWTVAGKAGSGATLATVGSDHVLRISTPAGSYDLWGRNYDAGRVTQAAPDEDFTVTVKFLSVPTERFELQGLVVEGADGGWLRVDTYSDGAKLKLFAATTTAGGNSTQRLSLTIPGGQAPYLSLERDGDTWTVRYSTDGVNWVTGGSFNHVMTVTDVGLFGGNMAGSDGFVAEIDYFEVLGDPLLDEDGAAVNVPPVAGDDALTSGASGLVISIDDLLANDVDPDGGAPTFAGFTSPANGTLIDNGDGTLSYVPNPGFSGQDSFEYTITDGAGGDTATVTITVAPADPFVADDFSGGALGSAWTVGTAPDTSVSLRTEGSQHFLVLNAEGDNRLWATNDAATALQTTTGSFDLIAGFVSLPDAPGDGQGLIAIGAGGNFLSFGIEATAAGYQYLVIVNIDGTPEVIASGIIDPDDARALRLTRAGDSWTVSISADGQTWDALKSFDLALVVTKVGPFATSVDGYEAVVDYVMDASSPLTIEDGAAPNALPVATHDAVSTDVGAPVSISVAELLANDSDADGDALSFTVISNPAHGTLVDLGNGQLVYTPNPGYVGPDSFEYSIGDGADSATGTVNIAVENHQSGGFSDDFRGDALGDGWTFLGLTGGAVTGADGNDSYLEITSPAGTAVDALIELNSPRVMQEIADGDFVVTARMLNEPQQPYQEHGLLVVEDSDTWIRYDIAMTSSGLRLIVATIDDGDNDIVLFRGIDPGEVSYLRIRRDDDGFVFETSDDGSTWTVRHTMTSDIEPTSVGLFAGSTTYQGSVPGFTSRVDYFEVSSDPIIAEDNDVPVAAPDALSTAQGAALVFSIADLIANDFDRDGDPLSFVGFDQPNGGTLVNNGNGTLTFTPNAGFTGTATFTYHISDGRAETTGKVAIGVTAPGNTAPVGVDDAVATDEDTPVSINVLANDTDANADPLTVQSFGQGTHGTVTAGSNGVLTYTPTDGYNGTDSFEVVISDGRGGLATTTVDVTVAPVNHAPVAGTDALSVSSGASVTFTLASLLANDSDADGDGLTIVGLGAPVHGTLINNGNGSYTYTPDAGYNGLDGIRYTLSDGHTTSSGVVSFDVAPGVGFISDDFSGAIVGADWRFEGPDGSAVTIQEGGEGFLRLTVPSGAHDPWQSNNALRYMQDIADTDFGIEAKFLSTPSARTQMQGILIEQDANNWLRFDVSYNGSGRVFAAETINGKSTAKINASINLAQAAFLRVERDGDTYTFLTSANGSDWKVAGSFVSAIAVTSAGTFAGTAHSANGFVADVDYVKIVGDVLNDDASIPSPPTAFDDTLEASVGVPLTFTAADLLANDTDPDNDTLSIVSITSVGRGSLTNNGNGTYTFLSNSSGVGEIRYTVSDGSGGPTSTATAWVDIDNRAPVAAADSATVLEDGSVTIAVLGNDSDPDGDGLKILSQGGALFGTVALVGNTLVYTPNANAWGTDTFSYTIGDGLFEATGTVSVNVTPVNDAPVVTDNAFIVNPGSAFTASIAELLGDDFDADGDVLTLVGFGTPSAGSVVNNGNGTFTYTPTPGFEGTATFSYTVSDGLVQRSGTVEMLVSEPIDVWYGDVQRFGAIGQPQEWINILGNVETAGLVALSYTLNDGDSRALSVGPDTRRLHDSGDFNVDIAFSELDGSAADDTVTIKAQYSDGTTITKDVTVEYEAGPRWPTSYAIDWDTVSSVQDVVQIADGQWEIEPDGSGVRPTQLGYDRLLVLGDETWDNYELSLTITPHDLTNVDPSGRDGGAFAIGMGWGGHTDSPKSGWQPKSGWEPGAAFFFSGKNFSLHSYDDFNDVLASQRNPLAVGTTYEMKVSVEQVGLYDRHYSLKIWAEGTAEPNAWTIQGTESFSLDEAPAVGSIYLNAHYYDVAFNDLSVTPIEGRDIVVGTAGADILSGVDVSRGQTGRGEIDVFNGEAGSDIFVLGEDDLVFYNDGNPTGSGAGDYAYIWDFETGVDTLQLAGSQDDYVIGTAPTTGPPGIAIRYLDPAGASELIAILDTTEMPQSNDFIYLDELIV